MPLTRLRLELEQDGQPAGPEPAAEALLTDSERHAPGPARDGPRPRSTIMGGGARARRLLLAIGSRRRRR